MSKTIFLLFHSLSVMILITACKSESDSITQTPVIEESQNVTDIDGNVYKTVQIGEQIWMAENLKTKHYSDGTPVQSYCYNNDTINADKYGRLYKWSSSVRSNSNPTAVQIPVQGICPSGWHLPDDSEWQILINSLGGNQIAGGKLKDVDSDLWLSPNTGASNESKFSALAAGFYRVDEVFMTEGEWAIFFNAQAVNSVYVKVYNLSYDSREIKPMEFLIHDAVSIRCIKD
ncbi:MAG: FISUMP domain-containing protein [bacterium]